MSLLIPLEEQDSISLLIEKKQSELQFESSSVVLTLSEISEGVDISDLSETIKLALGKRYIYISRTDIADPDHPHEKVQIGRLEVDGSTITQFISDSDKNLVEETFEILTVIPFFSRMRHKFGINKPNQEVLDNARKIAIRNNQVAQDKQTKIDEIRALSLRGRLSNNRDTLSIEEDSLVLPVGQAEYAFLSADNPEKYLETIGAGPCVIITIYDPTKNAVAMSHIDGLIDEEQVIRNLVGRMGLENVRIFGGNNSSISKLVSIKSVLDNLGASVIEWDILNGIKSVIIDKETGNVYNVGHKKNRSNSTFQDALMMQIRFFQGNRSARLKQSTKR